MLEWMEKHECNAICEMVCMDEDPVLIAKLQSYLKRFKDGKVADILRYLDTISIG